MGFFHLELIFFLNNDLQIRTRELKFWAKLAVSVCVVSGGWI